MPTPLRFLPGCKERQPTRGARVETACRVLASCVMATLYIREVPEAVAETLKERAAAEGKSLSAYVAAELARLATRPTNAEMVARLRSKDRSQGPGTDDIVAALGAGRR